MPRPRTIHDFYGFPPELLAVQYPTPGLPDASIPVVQLSLNAAKATMLDDPVTVTRLDGHRDFGHAVPTPDHFLPLLYLAGLASSSGQGADVLVDGYTYGSLSMTAYTIGMAPGPEPAPADPAGDTAQRVPEVAPGVPPDASNI